MKKILSSSLKKVDYYSDSAIVIYASYKTSRGVGTNFRVGVMTSAEREPIAGVWGQRPRHGPWAEPVVRGFGREVP